MDKLGKKNAVIKKLYRCFCLLFREKLNDKNMVVIFAVKEYMDAIYRELSRFIQVIRDEKHQSVEHDRSPTCSQGTENIGHLTEDASSLERIVTRQYEEIKSRIVMQVETRGSPVEVSLSSDCAEPGPNFLTCPGVGGGQVVNFTASVALAQDACVGDAASRATTVGSDE